MGNTATCKYVPAYPSTPDSSTSTNFHPSCHHPLLHNVRRLIVCDGTVNSTCRSTSIGKHDSLPHVGALMGRRANPLEVRSSSYNDQSNEQREAESEWLATYLRYSSAQRTALLYPRKYQASFFVRSFALSVSLSSKFILGV